MTAFFSIVMIFVLLHAWTNFWKIFSSNSHKINPDRKTSSEITKFRVFSRRMRNFEGKIRNLHAKISLVILYVGSSSSSEGVEGHQEIT